MFVPTERWRQIFEIRFMHIMYYVVSCHDEKSQYIKSFLSSLCVSCQMLHVSLELPFLITTSDFSNIDLETARFSNYSLYIVTFHRDMTLHNT
jgi:hypothetical protein